MSAFVCTIALSQTVFHISIDCFALPSITKDMPYNIKNVVMSHNHSNSQVTNSDDVQSFVLSSITKVILCNIKNIFISHNHSNYLVTNCDDVQGSWTDLKIHI